MAIAVLGTGSYLPQKVLSSEELGARLGVGEEWIFEKTGIRERRVAADHEATSDLAAEAARRALRSAGVDASEVDVLIVATSTPDRPIPATASDVQGKIGASLAGCFDVDAVCTGFISGLVTAYGILTANPAAHTAVVIGADTYSRILNHNDRRTAVLFGDGAGAIVLGKHTDRHGAARTTPSNGQGILATMLGSDGTQSDLVQIPGGGSRMPATAATIEAGAHYFQMRGREVRDLAARVLPAVVTHLLKDSELELGDIDLIVPHQANGVMLKELAETLGLRPGQLHLTVKRFGNTGAASVPITLDDAVRTGRVQSQDAVLLIAFGGGMTWGGVALRWPGLATRADVR